MNPSLTHRLRCALLCVPAMLVLLLGVMLHGMGHVYTDTKRALGMR